MKSAWGSNIYDNAAWNTVQSEEVDNGDFEEMLNDDVEMLDWNEMPELEWGTRCFRSIEISYKNLFYELL